MIDDEDSFLGGMRNAATAEVKPFTLCRLTLLILLEVNASGHALEDFVNLVGGQAERVEAEVVEGADVVAVVVSRRKDTNIYSNSDKMQYYFC
jgi:hypothetical protein